MTRSPAPGLLRASLLTLFLQAVFSPAAARTTGTIRGTVTDHETGESLPGANVQIQGTLLGDVCDPEGQFRLPPLPPGRYTLKVSFIGYRSEEVFVRVRLGQSTEVAIELETAPLQMDQIIVTGSRQPEELSAAVASISVLGADQIRGRNNFRLDEALLAVPGVTVVGENVNVRGGSGYNRLGGSRVLVLLDDVPILTSDLGATNWNLIPVTAVDHVEVLKGAASSLYGSGALSGVANIITKNPNRRYSLSFRQSSGFYDAPSVPEWKWTDRTLYFTRTDLGISHAVGPLGIRLDAAHHYSTGDREMGELERWFITGKSVLRLPGNASLTLFSSYSREERDLFLRWMRQNNALNVPPSDRGNRWALSGLVGYAVLQKLFSPTLSTKLRASYNRQLVGIPFQISTTAFRPAIGLSGEVQANWLPHTDHSISMGVDFKRDEVESDYYGRREGNAISPYIQEIWKISQVWQLNAGLRYDTYTLVGDSVETQLSPKIGASYQPWSGTLVHFSFGRGFRAASVVERFLDMDTGGDVDVLANPGLPPERSALFDVGLRQFIGSSFFAEVTAFSSTYENLIELTLIPDSLNVQFLTYPRARVRGIETSLQWRFWRDRLGISASATWMDPEELDSGAPLPYRPRFIAFATPSLRLSGFSLEADFRYASRLERVLVYPKDERVPAKVWNLRFGYAWRGVQFQFLANNAVNYNYTVSERVLGEIRNFAFSVSGEL